MDLMADMDAEDLSDPEAALMPAVALGVGAAGAAGAPPSGAGAFGGNERRMDS
jgi:hypothetical protein